jgi:hypothetical protein
MATGLRTCRILYYGPSGCGKRENLARIQASLPSEHRLAMATDDPSRQIAFLLRNGNQGDWQVFVQAVDAGQEPGVAKPERVPFDGVVFVCDSGAGALDTGLAAMESLKNYLDLWHLDLMSVPMVLQYNRSSETGILPVDRLESLLNPWGLLSFPSAAAAGEGVRETLKAVLSLTISHILQRDVTTGAGIERGLAIDSNPPVPGNEYTSDPPVAQPVAKVVQAKTMGQASLVIPVRVPRSALGADGTGRIILEVHIEDD